MVMFKKATQECIEQDGLAEHMEAALLEPVAVLGEGAAIEVEGAALDIHVERIGGRSLQ
jgi:hypothetical protein